MNVNGLNVQSKDTDWLNGYKNETHIFAVLQETHFRPRDTYRLKVRGWKKIFHANGYQKKARVAIFVSDKTDFKIKTVTRDKERHYIMINPRRKYNNYKYLCTQHRSTSIHKANANREIDIFP